MQTLAQPGPEAGVPTLVDAKFGLRQHQPLADGSARAPEQVSSPPQQEHLCSPGRAKLGSLVRGGRGSHGNCRAATSPQFDVEHSDGSTSIWFDLTPPTSLAYPYPALPLIPTPCPWAKPCHPPAVRTPLTESRCTVGARRDQERRAQRARAVPRDRPREAGREAPRGGTTSARGPQGGCATRERR